MTHTDKPAISLDVTRIENAEVRRVLRSLAQQTEAAIRQQQIEIEAILELILSKHLASACEYKIVLQKVSQHATDRAERVLAELAHAIKDSAPPTPAPSAPKLDSGEDERRVYRI